MLFLIPKFIPKSGPGWPIFLPQKISILPELVGIAYWTRIAQGPDGFQLRGRALGFGNDPCLKGPLTPGASTPSAHQLESQ